MQPYERLEAWRASDALAKDVFRSTAAWPTIERFGLVSQTRRAALSAAVNIVEGSARRGSRAWRAYLDIATGSLAETGYLIRFAAEVGVCCPADAQRLLNLQTSAARLTTALRRSLSPPKPALPPG